MPAATPTVTRDTNFNDFNFNYFRETATVVHRFVMDLSLLVLTPSF